MTHAIKSIGKKLYVVTAITNPFRFRTRYELYKNFEQDVLDAGGVLYTIEGAYGDRPFEITDRTNPFHIQLRIRHELWHKENLLNLAIGRLPSDWEYVAWMDADIDLARPDWAEETVQQLQHYHIVQMFTEAIDVGPKYEFLNKHKGFVWSYYNKPYCGRSYSQWHPGFAWAARREFINLTGGLFDEGILGSADRNMACSLIGRVEDSYNHGINKFYKEKMRLWQEKASYIKKNIGYVDGCLFHYWHGSKKNRQYKERWQILVDNDYNPLTDIHKDWQGAWQLTGNKPQLRDDIRTYFLGRNEDSKEVEDGR